MEASELVLNPDESIYHLGIFPEQIADTILLVGDQARVSMVSQYFDTIDCKVQNREFVTHTGMYNNCRITALSTGIGIDNIDIVLNELDALANIDLKNRCIKTTHRKLRFIRIGTSGALQANIPAGSVVLSKYSLGFDGMLHYYADLPLVEEQNLTQQFKQHTAWPELLPSVYGVASSDEQIQQFDDLNPFKGITLTAPGFYAAQNRELRLKVVKNSIYNKLSNFEYQNIPITNFEMETSVLFGLSKMLNHRAVTLCLIIANRKAKSFLPDYKKDMSELILNTLKAITQK